MTKRWKHVQLETSRHGKAIVYFRRNGGGPRVRLPYIDAPNFREAYYAALKGSPFPHVRDMPVTKVELRKQKTEFALRAGLKRARQRALPKGLAFDLTLDWALTQAEQQDFRCALTGIEFFAGTEAQSLQNPYAPSLDRIVPSLGYVQSNVRIVCFAVNLMLADWGPEVFERVANSYRYHHLKQARLSRTISRCGISQEKTPLQKDLTDV